MTIKQARQLLVEYDEHTVCALANGFIHRNVMHEALVSAGLATGRLSTLQEMDAADYLNRMITAANMIEAAETACPPPEKS